jgi:hypothetical protein
MTRARRILALLLAFGALTLTACAGFPTSGPINYGHRTDETAGESQNVAFLPDRPEPGATPAQIVEGFINAGTGPGVNGDWARAREFLAPELQEAWDPDASVTVDVFSERIYTETAEGTVDFTFDAVASVDDRGVYERAEVVERKQPFTLVKQADGEWRITAAPDGVVIDRDRFPSVFHRYSVMYFDPTWEYLVPDVRWFQTAKAATSITTALVNESPSEWLAESVATGFPENVTAVPSVPVSDDDVARVELSDSALAADSAALDRMLTQLEESLASAGVVDVVMSVGATPLAAEPVAVRSTRVPGAPLVLAQEEFGFLTGGEVDRIPGLSPVVESLAPVAVQVGPDRDLAAVRLTTGEVVRASADGSAAQTLDVRPGLIDPAIDPFGVVWSVPRDQPGALSAYLPSGESVAVAGAWADASSVTAMSISRDGTRLAATVTAGGRTVLWVAGVVREDGVPVRLSEPMQLATVGGPGIGVTWIDDVTIGVLATGESGAIVLEQVVGGPTSSTSASPDITSIAGGSGISSVRLRANDGTLYVKRGTTWQPSATGVSVLATQQGSPQ